MGILLINSSYRKNGNTQRVLDLIKEEYLLIARQKNTYVEFEEIYLAHTDIKVCQGCRKCFDKGEKSCPLKDDLLTIYNKIHRADGVVVASPVYVEDINGVLKNWIDRMAFNCHRPAFSGKPVILVTTSGSFSSNHSLKTMSSAFTAWGAVVIDKAKFITGALTSKEDIKRQKLSVIKRLALSLFSAVNTMEGTKKVNPSMFSLISFRVQQKHWQNAKNTQSYDYIYWKEKGWLQNSCSYYSEHASGWLKTKAAMVLSNIVSAFFYNKAVDIR